MFALHDDVKPLHEKFFTLSVSGDPSLGEDWDFVLENLNEITQGWMPKGVPTEQLWENVYRNLNPLQELKQTFWYEKHHQTSVIFKSRNRLNESNAW